MAQRTIEHITKRRVWTGIVAGIGFIGVGGVLALTEPGILDKPFIVGVEDMVTHQTLSTPSNGDALGAGLVGVGGFLLYAKSRLPDDVIEEKIGAHNE